MESSFTSIESSVGDNGFTGKLPPLDKEHSLSLQELAKRIQERKIPPRQKQPAQRSGGAR